MLSTTVLVVLLAIATVFCLGGAILAWFKVSKTALIWYAGFTVSASTIFLLIGDNSYNALFVFLGLSLVVLLFIVSNWILGYREYCKVKDSEDSVEQLSAN